MSHLHVFVNSVNTHSAHHNGPEKVLSLLGFMAKEKQRCLLESPSYIYTGHVILNCT